MTFSHWIDHSAGRAAVHTSSGIRIVTIHPRAMESLESSEGKKVGGPHFAQKNLADRLSLSPHGIFTGRIVKGCFPYPASPDLKVVRAA